MFIILLDMVPCLSKIHLPPTSEVSGSSPTLKLSGKVALQCQLDFNTLF